MIQPVPILARRFQQRQRARDGSRREYGGKNLVALFLRHPRRRFLKILPDGQEVFQVALGIIGVESRFLEQPDRLFQPFRVAVNVFKVFLG